MASRDASLTVYDKIRRRVAPIITPRHTGGVHPDLAQVFMSLLVLAIGFAIFNVVLHALQGMPVVNGSIAVGIIGILYVIARFLSLRGGILLTVVTLSAMPYGVYLATEAPFSLLLLVLEVVSSVLMVGLFLELAMALFVALVNSSLLLIFMVTSSPFPPARSLEVMMALSLLLVLVLLSVYWWSEQTERAKKNANWQDLLAAMPQAVILQDARSIVYANPAALALLNVDTVTDMQGHSLDEFIEHRESSLTSAAMFSLLHGGIQAEPTSCVLQRADGTTTQVTITTKLVNWHEETVSMSMLQEISASQAGDMPLPLRLFDEINAHTRDGVLIVDMKTREIVEVNPAYCAMSGYDVDELIGKSPVMLHDNTMDTSTIDDVLTQLHSCEPVQQMFVHQRRDGTSFHVEVDFVPLCDAGDNLRYSLAICRDLSESQVLRMYDNADQHLSSLMSDYMYSLRVQDGAPIAFDWVIGGVENALGYSETVITEYADWEAFVHDADKLTYHQHRRQLLAGEPHSAEYRLVRADDGVCWVQDTARPVTQSSQGKTVVTHIYGAMHDITDRIEAENALRDHVVQQAVVAELGLMALLKQRETDLLNHAVVLIEQVLHVAACRVFAYDQEANTLTLSASSVDDRQALLETPVILTAEPTSNQVAYTIEYDEPVIVTDLRTEQRFDTQQDLIDSNYLSSASIVIQGQSRPYGGLAVHTQTLREFNEDEIYFLQSVANVIGTFIERNRAQEAEAAQREFTDALREATSIINMQMELPDVLAKMQEYIATVVPHHEMSAILLLNADQQTVRVASSRDVITEEKYKTQDDVYLLDDLPVVEDIVRRQEAVRIANTEQDDRWQRMPGLEWIQSYLGAPIMINDHCIGVVDLSSSRGDAFTQTDADRLTTFAEKTANAIINAQRAQELEMMVQQRTDELKREREHLQTMLDSSGEGIFYTKDDIIQYANREMVNMTGYTLDEFIGMPCVELYDEIEKGDRMLDRIRETIRAGQTWRDEHTFHRKDDTPFEVGLTVSEINDGSDDDDLQTMNIVRDISQQKALEEQQERFIANAAHELRSPISNLNTRLYLIRKQPERADEHLDHLQIVVNRVNRLVGDLLDLASFEKGQVPLRKESLIVQDLITRIVTLKTAEANLEGITIKEDVPDEPLHILADSDRLEQVFINLVSNAVHYTPDGGVITIGCCVEDADVVMTVQDTGEGIAEDDLAHIFQPFYRVNKEKTGTGLGLSIAQEIVQRHDGTISAESTPGEGTTFFVRVSLLVNAAK